MKDDETKDCYYKMNNYKDKFKEEKIENVGRLSNIVNMYKKFFGKREFSKTYRKIIFYRNIS